MKKKVTIISIVLLILIAGTITLAIKGKSIPKDGLLAEIYAQNKEDVDAGVQMFMDMDIYDEMSEKDKVKIVGMLLDIYETTGIIKNLYYDETSSTYTFTYSKGDIEGALGAVVLKEFNPYMN